mmetsp:Transcript_17535/g.44679  ORF Transcript_17535/g.44679 Transcript_17535/m.44679 type:complete len:1244 (+) Transcript_17535:3584-7315(+)
MQKKRKKNRTSAQTKTASQSCTHSHECVNTRARTLAPIHTQTHTYTHTHSNTHTHTHTQAQGRTKVTVLQAFKATFSIDQPLSVLVCAAMAAGGFVFQLGSWHFYVIALAFVAFNWRLMAEMSRAMVGKATTTGSAYMSDHDRTVYAARKELAQEMSRKIVERSKARVLEEQQDREQHEEGQEDGGAQVQTSWVEEATVAQIRTITQPLIEEVLTELLSIRVQRIKTAFKAPNATTAHLIAAILKPALNTAINNYSQRFSIVYRHALKAGINYKINSELDGLAKKNTDDVLSANVILEIQEILGPLLPETSKKLSQTLGGGAAAATPEEAAGGPSDDLATVFQKEISSKMTVTVTELLHLEPHESTLLQKYFAVLQGAQQAQEQEMVTTLADIISKRLKQTIGRELETNLFKKINSVLPMRTVQALGLHFANPDQRSDKVLQEQTRQDLHTAYGFFYELIEEDLPDVAVVLGKISSLCAALRGKKHKEGMAITLAAAMLKNKDIAKLDGELLHLQVILETIAQVLQVISSFLKSILQVLYQYGPTMLAKFIDFLHTMIDVYAVKTLSGVTKGFSSMSEGTFWDRITNVVLVAVSKSLAEMRTVKKKVGLADRVVQINLKNAILRDIMIIGVEHVHQRVDELEAYLIKQLNCKDDGQADCTLAHTIHRIATMVKTGLENVKESLGEESDLTRPGMLPGFISQTVTEIVFSDKTDLKWIELLKALGTEFIDKLPDDIKAPLKTSMEYVVASVEKGSGLSIDEQLEKNLATADSLFLLPTHLAEIINELGKRFVSISKILDALSKPTSSTSFLAGKLGFYSAKQRKQAAEDVLAGVTTCVETSLLLGDKLQYVGTNVGEVMNDLRRPDIFNLALREVLSDALNIKTKEDEECEELGLPNTKFFRVLTAHLKIMEVEAPNWKGLVGYLKGLLRDEVKTVKTAVFALLEPFGQALVARSSSMKLAPLKRLGSKILLSLLWKSLPVKGNPTSNDFIHEVRELRESVLQLGDKMYAQRSALTDCSIKEHAMLTPEDITTIKVDLPAKLNGPFRLKWLLKVEKRLVSELNDLRTARATARKKATGWSAANEEVFQDKKREYFYWRSCYVLIKHDVLERHKILLKELRNPHSTMPVCKAGKVAGGGTGDWLDKVNPVGVSTLAALSQQGVDEALAELAASESSLSSHTISSTHSAPTRLKIPKKEKGRKFSLFSTLTPRSHIAVHDTHSDLSGLSDSDGNTGDSGIDDGLNL